MEQNQTLIPFDIYRHFKGNLYQIITVAVHSETGEQLVIYQALYGDYRTYARPLSMFLSKVDKEKYQETTQEYRFEKVKREEVLNNHEAIPAKDCQKVTSANVDQHGYLSEEATRLCYWKEPQSLHADQELQGNLDLNLEAFLDARSYTDKLQIFSKLRRKIDPQTVTSIEISLDLAADKESMSERLTLIERNLATRAKFESNRLR